MEKLAKVAKRICKIYLALGIGQTLFIGLSYTMREYISRIVEHGEDFDKHPLKTGLKVAYDAKEKALNDTAEFWRIGIDTFKGRTK